MQHIGAIRLSARHAARAALATQAVVVAGATLAGRTDAEGWNELTMRYICAALANPNGQTAAQSTEIASGTRALAEVIAVHTGKRRADTARNFAIWLRIPSAQAHR